MALTRLVFCRPGEQRCHLAWPSRTWATSSHRMTVVRDDWQEMVSGPGDFSLIRPGHDA
jgi:hypothetical protein